MIQPVYTECPCPLDSSCMDPVGVLVQDGRVVWYPANHVRGCGRPFHGTETWVLPDDSVEVR